MRRRRLGWIGIDLGARAIKIAQVERVGSRMRLHRGVVVPRADIAVAENTGVAAVAPVPSAEELSAAMTMRTGFSGRVAACVLPMHKADLRCLTIPDGSPMERRSMVANELSGVFGSAGGRVGFRLLGNATGWQQRLAKLRKRQRPGGAPRVDGPAHRRVVVGGPSLRGARRSAAHVGAGHCDGIGFGASRRRPGLGALFGHVLHRLPTGGRCSRACCAIAVWDT